MNNEYNVGDYINTNFDKVNHLVLDEKKNPIITISFTNGEELKAEILFNIHPLITLVGYDFLFFAIQGGYNGLNIMYPQCGVRDETVVPSAKVNNKYIIEEYNTPSEEVLKAAFTHNGIYLTDAAKKFKKYVGDSYFLVVESNLQYAQAEESYIKGHGNGGDIGIIFKTSYSSSEIKRGYMFSIEKEINIRYSFQIPFAKILNDDNEYMKKVCNPFKYKYIIKNIKVENFNYEDVKPKILYCERVTSLFPTEIVKNIFVPAVICKEIKDKKYSHINNIRSEVWGYGNTGIEFEMYSLGKHSLSSPDKNNLDRILENARKKSGEFLIGPLPDYSIEQIVIAIVCVFVFCAGIGISSPGVIVFAIILFFCFAIWMYRISIGYSHHSLDYEYGQRNDQVAAWEEVCQFLQKYYWDD